jgi:TPR repeat protein
VAGKHTSTEEQFSRACMLLDEGRARAAFHLFFAAARAGHLEAQSNLGYLFDTGTGVRRSRIEALHWYRKAARRGDPAAANNIGALFRDEGRPRLAVRWFEKAVALGNADALLEMAKLYAGPLKDSRMAMRLLKKVLTAKRVAVVSQEQAQQLLERLEGP